MYSMFSNRLYKMNEGPRGIVRYAVTRRLPSLSRFLALLSTTAEVPPGCLGGGPARLPRCINPACEATDGEGSSKAKTEPNRLCGGAHCAIPSWRSCSCQHGSLFDATAAGRLAHPPAIPHCSSFPLAIGSSCHRM
jgi:hypothetical protein